MQPSSKYASTEKTYAGGFVYKETDNIFSDIYTLDDTIDMSVSYTTPINSNFNKVNMGGWNSNSAAAYVNKRQRFRKEWTTSGGGKAYSNVNGIAVSKSPFTSTGNVTVVFSNGAGSKYYFGKSAQGTATIGSFGRKLITDFEVNKVIFKYSVTGWTKAEFDSYKENGTLADSHNISITDFVDNPANYLVRTFEAVPVAYWDGSTWKSNSLSNSPNIHINFLIDTDKVSGICNIQKHHYDNASGTTSYGEYNFSVYNSTSGNTAEIASLIRGAVVSELQNVGSGMGGFVLDSVTDPLELEPDLSLDEMTNMCDTGVQGAGDTLPAHDVSWCSALTVLKYDQYTLSYDVGSSGQTHFSRYNMYICTGMKGEYVDKMFAYAGVYFYTGSLQDLIDSGATPTNLKVTGMRLGEMNSAGQTTGNWIEPNQMDDYVGPNKDGSIIHPGYNPSGGGGGDDDDPSDDQESGGIYTGAQGMCNLYYMTASEIKNLQNWFRGTVFAPGIQIPGNFDPSDQLIGLMAFPIELGGSVDSTTITFRTADNQSVNTGVSCQKAYGDDLKFDLGTIDIPARMQQRGVPFLDYSCQVEVYIPFCDVVQLDVQQVIGTTLKCEMWISPATGDVSAMLSSGTHPVAYTSGNCAQQLPISVNSYGAIAGAKMAAQNRNTQAVFQAAQNVVKDITNAGAVGSAISNHTAVNGQGLVEFSRIPQVQNNTGLAVGAGIKAAGTMVNTALALTAQNFDNRYALSVAKNSAPTHVSGSFGACTSWHFPNYCYVKITRPHFKKPDNYGHTEAVPVVATKQLSSLSGLTTCVNPDVSSVGTATMQELETIKGYLMSGVIL